MVSSHQFILVPSFFVWITRHLNWIRRRKLGANPFNFFVLSKAFDIRKLTLLTQGAYTAAAMWVLNSNTIYVLWSLSLSFSVRQSPRRRWRKHLHKYLISFFAFYMILLLLLILFRKTVCFVCLVSRYVVCFYASFPCVLWVCIYESVAFARVWRLVP